MAPLLGMPSMRIANSPLVAWLFLRIIALVYLAAFASLYPQIVGLVGSDGILPAAEYLDRLENALGGKALWQVPTLGRRKDSFVKCDVMVNIRLTRQSQRSPH